MIEGTSLPRGPKVDGQQLNAFLIGHHIHCWIQANLDNFLIQYEPGYYAGQGSSLTSCNFENDPLARKRQMGERIDASCEFNKEWLSNEAADYKCISEEDYG